MDKQVEVKIRVKREKKMRDRVGPGSLLLG